MISTKSITSLVSVLDLAVWLEKHGQNFYEKAADATADPGLKATFSSLADEEQRHCAIYTDLYEFYTGKPGEGEELLGEYGKFIQLMIREISEDLVFEDMLSQEELIGRALQFEKNTLLYFTEVKALFRGKAGALVDAICREEKRHIQKLLESRQLLRSSTG